MLKPMQLAYMTVACRFVTCAHVVTYALRVEGMFACFSHRRAVREHAAHSELHIAPTPTE